VGKASFTRQIRDGLWIAILAVWNFPDKEALSLEDIHVK
jgi:hypothetical protein